MKTYMSAKEFCKVSGFSFRNMRRLCRSYLFPEFGYRTSGAQNATYMVDTERFRKMLEAGEFREVLEG